MDIRRVLVDRIEVVRGPNSTLWGINSTGGAINVVTKSPFDGQGGGARIASFGNEYAYAKAEVVIDGKPFADAGLRFKGNSSYRFSRGSMKKPFISGRCSVRLNGASFVLYKVTHICPAMYAP